MCINSICDFLVGQANGLLNNKRIIILHITLGVVSPLFVFQLIAGENIAVQQEITKSTTTTLKDVYCQCVGRNNTCEKWLMTKISTEKINKAVGFSSWHWKNGERKIVHIIYKMWHEVLAQHFIRAPVFVYHIVNASYYFNFLKFHNVALWFFIRTKKGRKQCRGAKQARRDQATAMEKNTQSDENSIWILTNFRRIESEPKSFFIRFAFSFAVKPSNIYGKASIQIIFETSNGSGFNHARNLPTQQYLLIFAYLFLNTNAFILHAQTQSCHNIREW